MPVADDCHKYVSSQAAAERTLTWIEDWIGKHLRLKVNAAKSGTGRVWERKFLAFDLAAIADWSRAGWDISTWLKIADFCARLSDGFAGTFGNASGYDGTNQRAG